VAQLLVAYKRIMSKASPKEDDVQHKKKISLRILKYFSAVKKRLSFITQNDVIHRSNMKNQFFVVGVI